MSLQSLVSSVSVSVLDVLASVSFRSILVDKADAFETPLAMTYAGACNLCCRHLFWLIDLCDAFFCYFKYDLLHFG